MLERQFAVNSVERTWNFLVNLRPVSLAALLFAIAFLVRVSFVLLFHLYENPGQLELERIAVSLATTGVYGNPFALPSGPSAHVAPGYPLLLAGSFRIFGIGITGQIMKLLLASAVTSFQCAILPAAARGLGVDHRAGLLAGLVSALYPAKPMVQIEGSWETPYTALFVMLLSVLTVQLWSKRDTTPRKALLHGLSWGVALLFAPALLPTYFVLLVAGAILWPRGSLRKYLSFAAIEVILVLACLAPWAIRNEYTLGFPIVARSNFGMELRMSNNDLAAPTERANDSNGVYATYDPFHNPAEAIKVRQMGEVAYNAQALREALAWISAHPAHFLKLCLERIVLFWFFVDRTSPVKTCFLALTAILGFAGLRSLFRSGHQLLVIVLAIIFVIYPLPHYLIHLSLRYRYPLDWIMTLFSAVTVVNWSEKFLPRTHRTEFEAPVHQLSYRDTVGRII